VTGKDKIKNQGPPQKVFHRETAGKETKQKKKPHPKKREKTLTQDQKVGKTEKSNRGKKDVGVQPLGGGEGP